MLVNHSSFSLAGLALFAAASAAAEVGLTISVFRILDRRKSSVEAEIQAGDLQLHAEPIFHTGKVMIFVSILAIVPSVE